MQTPSNGFVTPAAAEMGSPLGPDPGPPPAASWLPFAAVVGAATLLAAFGVLPRWAGLVHAVAPPPLDLGFDLRLLVARAPSYGVFAVGVVASLAIRSLVLASILEALGDARSLGSRFRSALRFYAVLSIPLLAAAGLEFSGYAAVYAWYAWAGLAITLVVMLRPLPFPAGVRRAAPLWSYAAILVLGALGWVGGGAVPVALIPVAGLLAVVSLRRRARRASPRSGAAAVAVTVSVMVAVTTASASGGSEQVAPNAAILLVPGVDTSSGRGALYRFDPRRVGFPCERVYYFSYAGPGAGAGQGEAACPIRLHRPYARTDTQRSLLELVDAFAEQVRAIRRETKRAPLAVVTHSQGAVIAWTAIASGRVTGVTHLVALAGFPHSPVGYPPPGVDGPGRVGADMLRALSAGSRSLGRGTFSPDAPLAREILARPNGLEGVFAQPLPEHVDATMVFATFDAIVAPEGFRVPNASWFTIDTTHVGIAEAPDAANVIRSALENSSPVVNTSVLIEILGPVLPAFMPPPADA